MSRPGSIPARPARVSARWTPGYLCLCSSVPSWLECAAVLAAVSGVVAESKKFPSIEEVVKVKEVEKKIEDNQKVETYFSRALCEHSKKAQQLQKKANNFKRRPRKVYWL